MIVFCLRCSSAHSGKYTWLQRSAVRAREFEGALVVFTFKTVGNYYVTLSFSGVSQSCLRYVSFPHGFRFGIHMFSACPQRNGVIPLQFLHDFSMQLHSRTPERKKSRFTVPSRFCNLLLRGLNPPHRVKSISMTTFSQQEVEFLQNHGNEVGRRTWLCIFDPKTDGCFDARDTRKLKEFLQDKYERKKWHYSKSKIRRDVNESPWAPGVQAVPAPHGPAQNQPPPGHPLNPAARPTRTLSQSQLSIWDRAPAVSPADSRTEVFTARPTRSQSFRDHPIKDTLLSGVERQRPGTVSSGMGHQNHPSSFPALPRPSASSTFKNSFTLGRTLSTGGGAPFRAFPKSLSLDFGGLSHAHNTISTAAPPPVTQDKYSALSQLHKVFSDNTPVTAITTAPSDGPPQYSTLFSNRLSSSSTPASSPGVPEATSGSQTFANFPNPFNSTASCAQPVLSPSNPFKSTASDVVSFPAPTTQSAFSHQQSSNQEANGFNSFPPPDSVPKVPRPMSVNPFTGNVYPSRGASLNPFI